MDQETLFTATKWDILKVLEKGPQSPLEISKKLSSSLANISQQLRLLEMAGVVKTKRISNRDKDMPRVLYSLAGNLSYLIATSDNFVDKKLLTLSDTNKIILKIWFLEDKAVRYSLEKVFWQIEPHLEQIDSLAFAGLTAGKPVLEYSGTAKLPSKIEVGGQFPDVSIRKVTAPTGHELYRRI